MRRNWIPLLLLAIAAVIVVVLWDGKCSAEAQAQTQGIAAKYPLRMGMVGKAVCDAQWLLAGRKPSKYRSARFRTYKKTVYKKRCFYGAATARAARATKIQMGFPPDKATNQFGRTLRRYLLGRRSRPQGYIDRAAKFVVLPCTVGGRVVKLAQQELGVREYGNNCGTRVKTYQAVTGAYCAAWCASFAQWLYRTAGFGTFASRSAHVFTIADRLRNYRVGRPKAGDLVTFHDRLGHMGIVERASSGGYYAIEGNASDQVLRRFHPYGNRPTRFFHLPGLSRRVNCA